MTSLQVLPGQRNLRAIAACGSPLETLDLVVQGTNLTAGLVRDDLVAMLRDLGHELADLATGVRSRVRVRCASGDEPWELGVEREGSRFLLSLVRGGPELEVAYVNRPFDARAVVAAVLTALGQAQRSGSCGVHARELGVAERTLASATWIDPGLATHSELVTIDPDDTGSVHFRAEFVLRRPPTDPDLDPSAARADLFALLQQGTVEVRVGDRTRTFADAFVFFLAEQLARLAVDVLDAWEQRRSMLRRIDALGIRFGVRLANESQTRESRHEAPVWLTIGERRTGESTFGAKDSEPWTFRLAHVRPLLESIIGFGRSLVRALVRSDPSQRRNLRLTAFRQILRELGDRLQEGQEDGTKVNTAPERYRAYCPAVDTAPNAVPCPPSKLRYAPGFSAMIPGIDLRSTFLCGEHIVVGGLRETAVIHRQTGTFLWKRPMPNAVSVVTPLGLARLFADGSIALHDFETGDTRLTTRVSPRVGGAITGAVISATGLPKLLVVTEGERHLSAIDLRSGERQWRHTSRTGRTFRMRRAGKLLVVASGDTTLTALDLASGEVVWRVCDRLRFSLQVAIDRESLFAVAGDPEPRGRGNARLYHLDAYAGTVLWSRELEGTASPFGPPLITDREVLLITHDRRGLGIVALDRASGNSLWSAEPGIAPVSSAWLTIDDRLVFNSESGAFFAVHTGTGHPLWRHALVRGMPGDQPRRLEPILRSGALFVPQQQVHVVSPRDGAILGHVPTDLIPDLLRVDERCDVYVAEESGHLASFRAGPKLRLVQ